MDFTFNEEGFTFNSRFWSWIDIESIIAYQVDLMTFDEICIDIVLKGSIITLSEEADGFNEFLGICSRKLKGFMNDWFSKVAFPAFATNQTLLYSC